MVSSVQGLGCRGLPHMAQECMGGVQCSGFRV